ncbi:ATP-binding cassette domain-containing protein [Asticcacaulis sp. BYS171W]|uniref:ATP-binding cassette domain-containing protein n=1 Tax=Asticcacaulis aquaticus TaxID=2984212 RepID=A0ABT5HU40_9CAUL|nr:ATP-binding cassette domain-containing protein [Asticcacaulis aquaticus]MDC7683590.1 ATP-binding cassette domain-containing protein [Asticcacaulis aquaticus]
MIRIALNGRVGDLDLDVAFNAPGEGITAIMGRSGSGKTTLLRAMAGLDRLTGEVTVSGRVWQDATRFELVHKRGVGYVFQEPSLFTHLSVQGNLDFAVKRATKAVDRAEIIDLLKIAPLLPRAVSKLSGGERQRVSLARALLSGPELLLMDEPLSSLDQTARQEILPFIRVVGARVPVIYVSHDPLEVSRLTERVLYLSEGRLSERPAVSLEGLSQAEIEALARQALGG